MNTSDPDYLVRFDNSLRICMKITVTTNSTEEVDCLFCYLVDLFQKQCVNEVIKVFVHPHYGAHNVNIEITDSKFLKPVLQALKDWSYDG